MKALNVGTFSFLNVYVNIDIVDKEVESARDRLYVF